MRHIPVLLKEVLEIFSPKEGETYIDATYGAGGHSHAIAKQIGKTGKVLALDANSQALKDYPASKNIIVVEGNFEDIGRVATEKGFDIVDGILYDLGLSSDMLDDPKRGFSFDHEGPLDMRFSTTQKLTAADVINTYPETELARIFREYGEEKKASRLARLIAILRKERKLVTTSDLKNVALKTLPEFQRKSKNGFALLRRVFQSLRIVVNDELSILRNSLEQAVPLLRPGGKLILISYHSLEDRIVKRFFLVEAKDCVCPPEFPECVCGKKPTLRILTKKPLTPESMELEQNSRARSAKLRAAVRTGEG
jgi:16S rRNA (cytosine1402-N4)-methyltransferase